MMNYIFIVLQIVLSAYFVIGIIILFQYFIFRGFTPFLPSRPALIDKIIDTLNIDPQDEKVFYSLGSGKSGFLRGVEKKYPNAKMLGVEDDFLYYFISKLQVLIKKSRIKIIKKDFYHLDVKDADIVYCHLDVEQFRELKGKLKLETKVGVVIISIGYAMPGEDASEILEVGDDMVKWYSIFSINKDLLKPKHKRHKAQKKVYIYKF